MPKQNLYSSCNARLKSGHHLSLIEDGAVLSKLSTLFAIDARKVSRAIGAARNGLRTSFVPDFLGFDHIPRDKVIEKHTRGISKTLFANSQDLAILVADGTYIFIEKSSNYFFRSIKGDL